MLGTTNTDTGASGKKRRNRRRSLTPEETMARLVKDNPNTTPAELREAAREYLTERSDFEDQASRDFNFWLVEKALLREIRDIKVELPEVVEAREERAALKQKLAKTMIQNHENLIEEEVKTRLLEYQTTYGKALGDCTGAECERLSRRYGDFFFELSKCLTRSETVRAHMSELELQAIARSHRMIGARASR